jgi:hypothetical protein
MSAPIKPGDRGYFVALRTASSIKPWVLPCEVAEVLRDGSLDVRRPDGIRWALTAEEFHPTRAAALEALARHLEGRAVVLAKEQRLLLALRDKAEIEAYSTTPGEGEWP